VLGALNEYTRREEIFWTLVSFCILVMSVVGDTLKFGCAPGKGPMIQDPIALEALRRAETADADFAKSRCAKTAVKLSEEVAVFKQRAAKAEKEAKDAAEKAEKSRKPGNPTPAPEVELPTQPAQSVLKQAKALVASNCKKFSEDAAGVSQRAAAGWLAAETTAALSEGGDEKTQQRTARDVLSQFKDELRAKSIALHTDAARLSLEKKLTKAREDSTRLKEGEPSVGLFSLKAAILVGVLLPVVALVISYISLRSASLGRAKLLVALRRFANTPEAGLQAAAIVRLAANPNGGEPGMVIGASLGGLLAAWLAPSHDPNVYRADLFVAGAMGGLLVGLAAQWLGRLIIGEKRWRSRTQELGDIEKPTIPVALVLGGVSLGLEKQFLRYFEALPIGDAAVWVQKLATQAEEQILAAADAAAQAQLSGGPSPWGTPPSV
jgi:hypothetical protein